MKGLKYSELKSQDTAHLKRQIAENQSRITTLEFQKVIGQLDNHAQINTLRRDIARMKTALREQEMASKN
jgi:large subunit ribosomal protein L29